MFHDVGHMPVYYRQQVDVMYYMIYTSYIEPTEDDGADRQIANRLEASVGFEEHGGEIDWPRR